MKMRGMVGIDYSELSTKWHDYQALLRHKQGLERTKNLLARSDSGDQVVGKGLRENISLLESKQRVLEEFFHSTALKIPNDVGNESAEDRVTLEFNTDQKCAAGHDHLEFMTKNRWIDQEAAVKMAGSGFACLRGQGALLEHALVQIAIRYAMENGFELVTVPDLIRDEIVALSGFHPRLSGDDPVFRLGSDNLALAGTAELPLAAMYKDQHLLPSDLPRRLVAVGHAFRREVGHSGGKTRGLYRLHQFTKVELFVTSTPEQAAEEYQKLLAMQLGFIQSLGFCGRQLEMSPKELGASAFQKRDIELWFPHSQRFGEVTSASWCTDYQARRLNVRVKGGDFAHTMNATAMATPRIIQCIAEHGGLIPGAVQSCIDAYRGK